VLCNREIKFGVCFDYARRLGADLIATGHYARVTPGEHSQLLRGLDNNKDQSYFLHQVPGSALRRTLFPIGELQKDEVRRIAKRLTLPTHDKKDSTGICFIGERPFEQFLATYLPAQPGEIRSLDGKLLGRHRGLMFYTLGQRHGLGIGGRRDEGEEPWYVADKNLADNVLVVAQGHNHPALLQSELDAAEINWIADSPPGERFQCTAKVRYRQEDHPCNVQMHADGTCSVAFHAPQRAITPGQYVVFYQGEVCLGGGVITRTRSQSALESPPSGRGAYPDIALSL
jgi:tRNA-specific 2-thiouridylase